MFKNLKKILYILDEDKKKLPLIILLFVGVSLLDIIGIGLIGPYIALVANPSTTPAWIINFFQITGLDIPENKIFVYLGLAIIFIFLTKTISIILVNFTIIKFSHKLQIRLRSFLMQSYQGMPFETYLSKNSSEFIHSIQTITSQFSQSVVLNLLRVSGDVIIAIVIIVMLGTINFTILFVLFCIFSCLILIYDFLFRTRLREYGSELNNTSMSMLQGVNEGIDGLKEIRILGKANFFYRKVKMSAELSSFYQARLQLISMAPRYLVEFIMVIFVVGLTITFMAINYDVANMILILGIYGAASLRLIPIATSINHSRIQIQFANNSVSRLFEDIYRFKNSQHLKINENTSRNILFETLDLENTSFSYKDRNKVVIDNISLSIKKGEIVAFIGESGSGKTTIVDLIIGLIKPTSGNILINKKPINEMLFSWHKKIAYLPQQIFLIDDTLKKNIALGCENNNIDNELLLSAIQSARLTDLVNSLEKGLDTKIGEKGVRLSGGQRQRVALARSFYHKRDILIMDESTSALDTKIEEEVNILQYIILF